MLEQWQGDAWFVRAPYPTCQSFPADLTTPEQTSDLGFWCHTEPSHWLWWTMEIKMSMWFIITFRNWNTTTPYMDIGKKHELITNSGKVTLLLIYILINPKDCMMCADTCRQVLVWLHSHEPSHGCTIPHLSPYLSPAVGVASHSGMPVAISTITTCCCPILPALYCLGFILDKSCKALRFMGLGCV